MEIVETLSGHLQNGYTFEILALNLSHNKIVMRYSISNSKKLYIHLGQLVERV